MAMAFPIPSHLPRKTASQDVSSKILSKLDEATSQTLNVELTASWLTELDETIQSTKNRIRERMNADLPAFEQQLSSSKSVQTRLQTLTSNVENLSQSISHPETGVIPMLVKSLASHAALSQKATDAKVTYDALFHLSRCRGELLNLTSLVEQGKLPDAVKACETLEKLLGETSLPLSQASVVVDLKYKFRAAKDRAEEQLSDSYSRGITVSPAEIQIRPFIQVRQSATILTLDSILSSLSPQNLTMHLNAFRRDLMVHYILHTVTQPTSISLTTSTSAPAHDRAYKLTQFPSPPNSSHLPTRLSNLSMVLTFLSTYFFSCLPSSQLSTFRQSFCKPISDAILNHLLIPALPSSFARLPTFLDLVKQAIEFEDKYIVGMLDTHTNDRVIKTWADGVSGHYERKRRMEILERARDVITRANERKTFRVEVGHTRQVSPVRVEAEVEKEEIKIAEGDSQAWGFDDEEKVNDDEEPEADGWGFDDDEPEPEQLSEQGEPPTDEKDPSDAWGWNDDEDSSEPNASDETLEETAWDDPWNDEPVSPKPSPSQSPKKATRLEKFSAKGKHDQTKTNGQSVPTLTKVSEQPPAETSLATLVERETYLVSVHAREILLIVEDVLKEGHEFALSNIFPSTPSSLPGTTLLQSAWAVVDLFRALNPVHFCEIQGGSGKAMQFSNDCLYLRGELGKLGSVEKLVECQEKLRILGDSWFDDTIERQRQSVNGILATVEGFTYTTEQDRYDECEDALSRVVREIRVVAHQWEGILAKSKYYTAIGLVADAALSRILEDVLALPDITEVESHRLSELCRILNSLEGLFAEDTNQPSFVATYVPSWLKFSYLSELLEASMADISYLFDEGALVDFTIDELTRLVQALFADTPLRATTISKLLGGRDR